MASPTALRWMLGASLGLGAIDLVMIDVALAPEVIADSVVAPRFTPPQAALLAVTATGTVAPTAPVAPEPPAVVVTPVVKSHVYFATMSATLDDAARVALDGLAVAGTTIVLEGHADQRGTDAYNTKLSRKRALAVQRYLVERGAERARIRVRFAGEDGAGDPDLWRDRRVDIQITGGPR